jgi:hypothetical protein
VWLPSSLYCIDRPFRLKYKDVGPQKELRMSGTISTTLTSTYYVTVNPTAILGTGAVEVTAAYAVAGGSDLTLINHGNIGNTLHDGVSFAAQSTITNVAFGTITASYDGVLLGAGGTVTNAAFGTITSTHRYAIIVNGGDGTVTNSGSIGGGFAGVNLTDGGTITNQAGAAITAQYGSGRGIQGLAAPVTVTNAGNIYGHGGSAFGIALYGGGSVTNLSGGTIHAIGGSAGGIVFGDGGIIDNEAGGTIEGGNPAIVIGGGSTTIVNAGTIIGGSLFPTEGVIDFTATFPAPFPFGNIPFLNAVAAPAAGTVVNAGTIIDEVSSRDVISFFSGFANRVVDDPGAVFQGIVDGGGTLSTLELASAASAGTLTGLGTQFIDFGSIAVDTGADWILAGSNTLQATATLSDAGTLSNTGSFALYGTMGISGTLINAGSIAETATQPLQLLAGAYLRNQATGVITASARAAVYGLPSSAVTVTNAGTIAGDGNAGFGVYLKGGGIVTNSGTITGAVDAIYEYGQGGTVINTGLIATTGFGSPVIGDGVFVVGSATVINGASTATSALIGGTGAGFGVVMTANFTALTSVGTVINYGTIGSPTQQGVNLAAGTVVNGTNLDTAALINGVKVAGYNGLVQNFGTIDDPSGFSVYMNGGNLTNGSATDTTALILNTTDVENVQVFNGTLANYGSIVGGSINGIYLGLGSFYNAVSGVVDGGKYGFHFGGPVTVVNAGTIMGKTAFAGVTHYHYQNTLINSGVIVSTLGSAGTAVSFGVGNDLLVVDPGATFVGTVSGGGGTNTLQLASSASAGTLSGIGTQFVSFAQVTVDAGASWTLAGANTVVAGTTFTELSGASVSDAGTLVNDGTIVLDPSRLTVAALTGTGSVTIDAGSTLGVAGTIAGSETLGFGGSGAYLHLYGPDDVTGSITNFTSGETIDLKGVDFSSVAYASGQLTFSGGGDIPLALADGGVVHASASADGTDVTVLCFCANTLILTPTGDRPVQDLTAGDLVVTHRGEVRPLVWVGVGKVLATRGQRSAATPVIVRRGALARDVPNRDLRVTKGHALWFDGVLIPVEFLVNHRLIEWDDRAQEVDVYHLELASHDVLVANGAAAESYRDDGNRWLFQNANSGWDLPPLPPCAPVLTGGPVVDAVWRRLLERSDKRRGLPLTDDPDLHLLVDGRRLDAVERTENVYVFRLPAMPSILRIGSRAAAPAELGLARDPRPLGVALRRLVLRKMTRFRIIKADDKRLSEGFHAFEPETRLRWTNGDAAIPTDLCIGFTGSFEVALDIGATTQYLEDGSVQRVA